MNPLGWNEVKTNPVGLKKSRWIWIFKDTKFLPTVRLKDFQFAIRNSSQNIFLPYRIAPLLLNQLKVSMNVGTYVDPRKIVFGFRSVNF